MWNIGAAEMITGRSAGGGTGTPGLHVGHHRDRTVEHRREQEVDVAAVRQHHALGAPGRAAGEEDDERVVLVDRDVGERRVGRVLLERGEVAFELDHGQAVGERDAVEPVEAAPVAEEHLRFGELDRVRDLLARPPAVEPDGDRAERGGRPEHERVLDRVRRDDRDAVAGPDPVAVAQRGRDRRDRLEDRRERVLAVGEDHVGPVAQSLGRAVQQLDERLRPVGEHEHRRAEHGFLAQLERRAGAGERGEDGFGNGLRRPDQRGHAGRRCESSTPLSRMTSFESSGVKPKFSRSLM